MIFTLLALALQLLIAASNPSVPASVNQTAISVANLAIQIAQIEIKKQTSTPVSIPVSSPIPSLTPSSTPSPVPSPVQMTPSPTPIMFISPTPSPSPSLSATPEPSPLGSQHPTLTEPPVITFNGSFINSISYKADELVVCLKDVGGTLKTWGTECSITGSSLISTQYVSLCNAYRSPHYPFEYVLESQKTYTCTLILTDKDGNDTRAPFTFTKP